MVFTPPTMCRMCPPVSHLPTSVLHVPSHVLNVLHHVPPVPTRMLHAPASAGPCKQPLQMSHVTFTLTPR